MHASVAQAHADAVVRGDMDTVIGDFAEELRPSVPQLAQNLPQPVTSAEVLEVTPRGEETVVRIRYSGADNAVTIRTRWRDIEGRPQIVHGEPAD